MRIKKVNRYYCEFCKKSGCSAYHIRKHEISCTMNPSRKCRMCELMGNGFHDLNILKELLPDPKNYWLVYAWNHNSNEPSGTVINPYFQEDLKKAFGVLERKAENCPMCILAALKQTNIPCWLAGYDYVKELKAIWQCVNDEREGYA